MCVLVIVGIVIYVNIVFVVDGVVFVVLFVGIDGVWILVGVMLGVDFVCFVYVLVFVVLVVMDKVGVIISDLIYVEVMEVYVV